MLEVLLKIILNTILIGSMLAFVVCSVCAALAGDSLIERTIRFGMLFSGALVVLGAQAAGLSFAQVITDALTSSGALTTTAGVVVPGAVGAGIGSFLVRFTRYGNVFVMRILIFVCMLAGAQFAEIYASAVNTHGLVLGRSVLPNISFVVGILLYVALTYDPKNPKRRETWRWPWPRRPDEAAPAPSQGPVWPDPRY